MDEKDLEILRYLTGKAAKLAHYDLADSLRSARDKLEKLLVDRWVSQKLSDSINKEGK